MFVRFLMTSWLVFASTLAFSLEEFSIFNGTKELIYSKEKLLSRSDLVKITMPLLSYPGKSMTVSAIPVRILLEEAGLTEDQVVLFKCVDGFSGVLEKTSLLAGAPGKSEAFLAIEEKEKWPPLSNTTNKEGLTAGTFYLVWRDPELSNIPAESWPYQLSGLRFESNFRSLFPNIFPKSNEKAVLDGFIVYQRHCMACHSMNRQGTSKIGPDLNIPMSPVEYFKEEAFLKFLVDPTAVREWSSMKMRWLDNKNLGKDEMKHLVSYLEHMAKNRVK